MQVNSLLYFDGGLHKPVVNGINLNWLLLDWKKTPVSGEIIISPHDVDSFTVIHKEEGDFWLNEGSTLSIIKKNAKTESVSNGKKIITFGLDKRILKAISRNIHAKSSITSLIHPFPRVVNLLAKMAKNEMNDGVDFFLLRENSKTHAIALLDGEFHRYAQMGDISEPVEFNKLKDMIVNWIRQEENTKPIISIHLVHPMEQYGVNSLLRSITEIKESKSLSWDVVAHPLPEDSRFGIWGSIIGYKEETGEKND